MKKLWKKFIKIPHLYAKLIIIWCVLFGTACSAYALRILSRTGQNAADLLGVILAFFGGELLLLCLRAVLTGDKKDKKGDS